MKSTRSRFFRNMTVLSGVATLVWYWKFTNQAWAAPVFGALLLALFAFGVGWAETYRGDKENNALLKEVFRLEDEHKEERDQHRAQLMAALETMLEIEIFIWGDPSLRKHGSGAQRVRREIENSIVVICETAPVDVVEHVIAYFRCPNNMHTMPSSGAAAFAEMATELTAKLNEWQMEESRGWRRRMAIESYECPNCRTSHSTAVRADYGLGL